MSRKASLETRVIHAGSDRSKPAGAVVGPIFQSSTFLYAGQEAYEDLKYIRLNNTPNHQSLHRKLADLESTEASVVASSGMAAVAGALLAVLKSGDHLLAQNTLYGGTLGLLNEEFSSFGIPTSFVDPSRPEGWKAELRRETRAFYLESISNPLVEIGDLESVIDFCREFGLLAIIDNTFATPVNFRPLEHGFDLVIHSATKYLNGHTDLVAGAVAGRRELIEKVNGRLLHLGGCLDPHACFLLDRGLKTLCLRVGRQNESAERLSRFLAGHPGVDRVYYPALSEARVSPGTRKWFEGFGGMLSFELKGDAETAARFTRALRIPYEAPSLGGVESLVTRPCTTSHSGLSAEERQAGGISDRLIRYSVGIEACDDLLEDLDRGLREVRGRAS